MGTPRVSLGCPRTSQPRGVVPWGNIETMESNPWAPISQMAKLRLREADDVPTSGWWRGRLSFSPLLVCPGSLCGLGGGEDLTSVGWVGERSHLCGLGGGEISPLWAGWGRDLTSVGWVEERSHLCGLGGGEWGLSWGTPGEGLEEVAQEEL